MAVLLVLVIGGTTAALGPQRMLGLVGLAPDEGAATPEQAAERLVAAVEDKDLASLFLLLHPDEREPLQQVAETFNARAGDLGLSSGLTDQANESTWSIDLSDLEVDVDEYADSVAGLSVEGRLVVSDPEDELPGPVRTYFEDLALYVEASGGGEPDTFDDDSLDLPVGYAPDMGWYSLPERPSPVILLKTGGRWYFSLTQSMTAPYVAEVVQDTEPQQVQVPRVETLDWEDQPDLSASARDPEDLAETIVDAMGDVDVAAGLEVVAPGALQPAGLAEELQDAIDLETGGSAPDYRVDITDFEYEVEELGGGRSRVSIEEIEVIDSAGNVVGFDGQCLYENNPTPTPSTACLRDLEDVGFSDQAAENLAAVVVRHQGDGIVLDPWATAASWVDGWLQDVARADFQDAFEQ